MKKMIQWSIFAFILFLTTSSSSNAMLNQCEKLFVQRYPVLTSAIFTQKTFSSQMFSAIPQKSDVAKFFTTKAGQQFNLVPPRTFFQQPRLAKVLKEDGQCNVATPYGLVRVHEPVLRELLEHPALQRLMGIGQYGVSHYVFNHKPFYSRYSHSIGVWAILRRFGASLEEQIAGLLHDASHTIFSHAGDIFYEHVSSVSSYQDAIHEAYLRAVGIDKLLEKHGVSFEVVMTKTHQSSMLEADLPDLCADRLDYNLQGGLIEELLTPQDRDNILNDLHVSNNCWYFTNLLYARLLAEVSLFCSVYVWGGPTVYFVDQAFSRVLKRASHIGILSATDLHFGSDEDAWKKLCKSDDSIIQKYLNLTLCIPALLADELHSGRSAVISTKFRGIDPWIKQGNEYRRLSEIDDQFRQLFVSISDYVARLRVVVPHELEEPI